MFRERDAQGKLFEADFLSEKKAERLKKTWADVFRREALHLVEEKRFAEMYSEGNGRPNVPVQLMIGILVLKEMFNLTDQETLDRVEWDLQWQHALKLSADDAHLCQKTLHNFRARLMEHDLGRVVFEETAGKMIEVLGTKVARQRLDSTHIVSNVARLKRLGLFTETIRLFLRDLKQEHPRLFSRVIVRLRRRYLRDDGSSTGYGDGRSEETRRRLDVCARDAFRLRGQFEKTAASKLASYALLDRLVREQCTVDASAPRPDDDDDDAGERHVPVRLTPAKEIESSSLQTPHDPDVSYSGHKGKGYSVQIAETCHEDNATEIITYVAVTSAHESDANATIPALEAVSMRGLHATECLADTTYGSAANAIAAERVGTTLISPVSGQATPLEDDGDLTAADFRIDLSGRQPAACPNAIAPVDVIESRRTPNRIELHFDEEQCRGCPLYMRCPAEHRSGRGTFAMGINLVQRNLEVRRREQDTDGFAKRYAPRAGIEATNSEAKRAHGLGRPRVRGKPRVELATFFKATACNIKRMINVLLKPPEMPRAEPA